MEILDLSTLYQRYGYIVLRICNEILGDTAEAHDALQETFFKFWRHAERYPSAQESLAGLRKTALSCAIDLLRSRQRRDRKHDKTSFFADDLHPPTDDKLRRYHDRQMVALLLREVRVDEETLTMAYLYYLDEMTLEEVASETGYSRRAVQMKLDRFCEAARKFCSRKGIAW